MRYKIYGGQIGCMKMCADIYQILSHGIKIVKVTVFW